MMMMTASCISIAVGMICYSSDGNGTKITCSDIPMQGTFTCKEWNDLMNTQVEAGKRNGCMSPDGSSSSCLFVLPHPPR